MMQWEKAKPPDMSAEADRALTAWNNIANAEMVLGYERARARDCRSREQFVAALKKIAGFGHQAQEAACDLLAMIGEPVATEASASHGDKATRLLLEVGVALARVYNYGWEHFTEGDRERVAELVDEIDALWGVCGREPAGGSLIERHAARAAGREDDGERDTPPAHPGGR